MTEGQTVADTGTVVRGMVDLLSRSVVARVTGLLTSVVLARLLVPEEFGRAAVAMSIVNIAVFFLDSGMTAAALRQPAEPEVSLLRALSGTQLLITTVAVAIITPIALLGDHAALTIAGLVLLPLLSLQTPMLIVAERRLDFRNISNAELFANLGSQVVSIALAASGAGVWALVVGTVVRPMLSALWMAPTVERAVLVPTWRIMPAFPLLRDAFRLQVMPASMVVRDQGSTLIAAAAVGASALGTWVLVGRLLSVSSALYGVLARVAYPAVAARHREGDLDFGQIERAIGRIAFVSAWMLGLTCAGSIYAVPLIFGEEWRAAVPALLGTCPGMLVITSISTPSISLMMIRRQVTWPVIGVILHAATAWALLVFGPFDGTALAIGLATSAGSLVEAAVIVCILHRDGMCWRQSATTPLPALAVASAAVGGAAGIGALVGPILALFLAPLAASLILLVGSVTILRAEWRFVVDNIRRRNRHR